MPQKQNPSELRTARAAKNFLFFNFLELDFFHKFFTKFLNISSTRKSSKTHQIFLRNVERSTTALQKSKKTFETM
jgi:hypothetical protein